MQESSICSKGDSVNYDTILGKIGGTGPTDPKSYDDHLHYDIFTNDHAYHSNSTLTVLLGNSDFWGFQVSSNGGYKHTYDPKLYYSNTLNKRLKVKK